MCVIWTRWQKWYSGKFCVGFVKSEQEAMKAAKRQIEECQRVRDTFRKQIQFLQSTQYDLEKQKEAVYADYLALKNGTNVIMQNKWRIATLKVCLVIAKQINLYSRLLPANDAIVFMFLTVLVFTVRRPVFPRRPSVCLSVCLRQTRGLW